MAPPSTRAQASLTSTGTHLPYLIARATPPARGGTHLASASGPHDGHRGSFPNCSRPGAGPPTTPPRPCPCPCAPALTSAPVPHPAGRSLQGPSSAVRPHPPPYLTVTTRRRRRRHLLPPPAHAAWRARKPWAHPALAKGGSLVCILTLALPLNVARCGAHPLAPVEPGQSVDAAQGHACTTHHDAQRGGSMHHGRLRGPPCIPISLTLRSVTTPKSTAQALPTVFPTAPQDTPAHPQEPTFNSEPRSLVKVFTMLRSEHVSH